MGKAKTTWLDDRGTPKQIEDQAQRLGHFMAAMADGKIDDAELAAQEKRLVERLREVEPMLDEKQHEAVTNLIVELAAYDIMRFTHTLGSARPKKQFVG